MQVCIKHQRVCRMCKWMMSGLIQWMLNASSLCLTCVPSLRWSCVCLPPSPLMCSSVSSACPAHPPPFRPSFTITMAACWDLLPCIGLTTAGCWQGPIHVHSPPWTIKTPVRLAGSPPWTDNITVVVSADYNIRGRRQAGRAAGFMHFILFEVKREGFGFMYPTGQRCSLNGQENFKGQIVQHLTWEVEERKQWMSRLFPEEICWQPAERQHVLLVVSLLFCKNKIHSCCSEKNVSVKQFLQILKINSMQNNLENIEGLPWEPWE